MKMIYWLLLAVLLMPMRATCGALTPFTEVPIPAANPQTPAKIELGKMLFFDRRLSGDGTMNCGTCHDPNQGYGDGMDISLSYPTTRNWRNAPTLIGVAFQKLLFHDGRAASLEEQALFPMMSAFEMNQNLDFVEEEIRSVPEYVTAFTEVFGDADITKERIAMALAAFERSLNSQHTPLDRFLGGAQDALSPDALLGYRIFTGKGKCTTCHYGVKLADDRFHVLNVKENPEHLKDPRIAATRRFVAKIYQFPEYRSLATDPGRYLITKDPKDWKAFRTPTLREIGQTAPYMHNGIYGSLQEVIAFFNEGGGKDNKVLQPLHLSEAEMEQLRVFLEEGLTGTPIALTYPRIP